MPYSKNETKEQTAKIERCISSVMVSDRMREKYKDSSQRKSHAVAICKSQVLGLEETKKGLQFAKNTIPYIRNELSKLKLSTDISDVEKDILRRKLIMSAKKLGIIKLSNEDIKSENDDNTLTDEEKELTEEEMIKIEKELGIEDVELDTKEVTKMDESEIKDEEKHEDVEESKTETPTEEKTEEKSLEEPEKTEVEEVEVKTDEATETETKKEEVLAENDEIPSDNSGEESKTTETEKPVEEIVEETPADVKVEAEVVEEETKSEDEKKSVETDKEKEIKTELSNELLPEIKNELTKAYSVLKEKSEYIVELQKEIEKLKLSNDALNVTKASLSAKVEKFEETEMLRVKDEFNQKILSLSSNYKKLGQDKSVSELSKLNINTINELENVVSVALKAQDYSVIVPSQAMRNTIQIVEDDTNRKKLNLSKLDNTSFFANVCNELEVQRNSGRTKINV